MMSEYIKSNDEQEEEGKINGNKFHAIRSYTDIQRLKIEKLMANPDKPVRIPDRPVDRDVNRAPEFNHNVMGSSAGAGSGEFHLYRQMRRKEQNRVKQLAFRKKRDELDAEFKQKLEDNQKASDEKTAKKRLKRQKKKAKKKANRAVVVKDNDESVHDTNSDSSTGKEESLAEEDIVAAPLINDLPSKDPLVIHFN